MPDTSDISKDVVVRFKNDLFVVTEFQHVNPGKGAAFTRVKMRSIGSGKSLENTWKSGENVDIVDVERRSMQYLFSDANGATFMDSATYDQVLVPKAMLEGKEGYLKEGIEALVVMYEGAAVAVQLPRKITFTVTEAQDAVRGDTSGNVTKDVTLDTGIKVKVPMFIKQGEKIIINTDTGEYVERA
ncbi:elongation factor P [Patescibacteria group bacterium]|nr:MAG: elongation factor P [Patescibacteria group bacterium]